MKNTRTSQRQWLFDFLRYLDEAIPSDVTGRRHTLSRRTIAERDELVLSIADHDDNWLLFLDDADCAKPPKAAVRSVVKFLRMRQKRERLAAQTAAARHDVTRRAVRKMPIAAQIVDGRYVASLGPATDEADPAAAIEIRNVDGRYVASLGDAEVEIFVAETRDSFGPTPVKLVMRPASSGVPAAA